MVITGSIILCNIPRLRFHDETLKTFWSLKMQMLRRRSGKRPICADELLFCGDGGLFSVIAESKVCCQKADRTDLFSKTWKLLFHSPGSTDSEFKTSFKTSFKKNCHVLRIFFSLSSRSVIKTGEVDHGGKNWVLTAGLSFSSRPAHFPRETKPVLFLACLWGLCWAPCGCPALRFVEMLEMLGR